LQRLGTILAQLKLPGPGPLELRQIEASLPAIFGAATDGARVASYRRGRLVIEVKSSARAFEYQAFARAAVIDRLRRLPGLEQLKELAFKPGAWRAHGRQ